MPPEIGRLTSLQLLVLIDNPLTAVPSEIGQLAILQLLDLGDNRLTAVPLEIGQLTGLQEFYLNGNQLTAVPPGIFQLASLQTLDLSYNLLTIVPSEIGQLAGLQALDLGGNRLTAMPPEIGQLASLQRLSLRNNQLTAVPLEIGQLANLQDLDLSDNRLTVVPPEIGRLAGLQALDLGGNRLTAVPPEIGQLAGLQALDLSHNRLTTLPAALRGLAKLKELRLHDNPLPLPPELLGDFQNPSDPQAILDAYFQASRPLREAKLLLVGEGGVGKTSLVERLLYDRPLSDKGKTVGVDIHRWNFGLASADCGLAEESATPNPQSAINVNVWDFGGQEIYHATHQFFLTRRSLYLLVIEARKDEAANRLDYWLRNVQSFAGDAPVILVVNKSDQGRLALDARGLMLKYPAIRDIVHTSCVSGAGLPQLRAAIEAALAALPHINDWIPLTWFEVKEQLAALSRDTLPYESYVELCRAAGVAHEAAQRTLARFLHDLGAALNFQEDRRLAATHVLNPEWVTGGIYRILNAPSLQERGLLHLRDLDGILDPQRYPPEKQPFLLEMMHKFELSAPLDRERYLVPGLLPKEHPSFDWPEGCATALEYRYAILPTTVLARLMVRLHAHVWRPPRGRPVRWRNGLVIQRDGCRALIVADPAAGRLTIALDGPPAGRRLLLTVVRAELDEIHASFAKLEPEEWVPIPGWPDKAIPYQALLNLEARGQASYYDAVNDLEFDVRALLDGIESAAERDIRQLVSRLATGYSLGELRDLAFSLDVEHEDLPHHATRGELARELAKYLERRGRLPELEARLRRDRPGLGG